MPIVLPGPDLRPLRRALQGYASDCLSDEELLHRFLAARDEGAFTALVRRHGPLVLGVCRRVLHHRQDAEDVTQETFLRVFRSLRRWDSSRPLRPWVLGIAVNRCRTWMGRRAKRPELADYLHETAARDDSDDSVELVAEIRRALAGMRPEYQSVFVLFHEQGHSYEEIAAVHGRPVGTIKTWLHRTRLEVLTHLRRRGMVPPADTAEEPADPPAARP